MGLRRGAGKEITEPTRFKELIGAARIAFAQDIWREIEKQFPGEE